MIIKCKADGAYDLNVTLPSICPRCGRDLSAIPLSSNHVGNFNYEETYAVVIQCLLCKKSIYLDVKRSSASPMIGIILNSYPGNQIFDLPSGIEVLYPDFAKMYCEAASAEARNFSGICGMGFRKALEILVKQYAVKAFPADADTIYKEFLSQTISRIQNAKIQTLARAATWLGNDQTHLQTIHPEYSVADIKAFIKTLCYHILMEEEVSRAENLITKSRR